MNGYTIDGKALPERGVLLSGEQGRELRRSIGGRADCRRQPSEIGGGRNRRGTFAFSQVGGGATGTALILLAPAVPMKMDAATKVNAMSAIRGCLRTCSSLECRKPGGFQVDALMRAGRLLHATRDTVPEGLAGSGRWDVRTRCRRVSPCLLCCRDSFSLLWGTGRDEQRRSHGRLAGAELSNNACGEATALAPTRRDSSGRFRHRSSLTVGVAQTRRDQSCPRKWPGP